MAQYLLMNLTSILNINSYVCLLSLGIETGLTSLGTEIRSNELSSRFLLFAYFKFIKFWYICLERRCCWLFWFWCFWKWGSSSCWYNLIRFWLCWLFWKYWRSGSWLYWRRCRADGWEYCQSWGSLFCCPIDLSWSFSASLYWGYWILRDGKLPKLKIDIQLRCNNWCSGVMRNTVFCPVYCIRAPSNSMS